MHRLTESISDIYGVIISRSAAVCPAPMLRRPPVDGLLVDLRLKSVGLVPRSAAVCRCSAY